MENKNLIKTENQQIITIAKERLSGNLSLPFLFKEYAFLPGFCDVHVHFREPGFSYKETVKTGCESAVAGGYTCVCTMPNLNPVPDGEENLSLQLSAIKKQNLLSVVPYGSITVGLKGEELSDMEKLSPSVVAFTDDGRGVQRGELMKRAMEKAKTLNKIIVAHCEDNSLLNGGYIHDGEYARAHGHKGISSQSEYAQVARDLELVAKTGCKYHVCHVSTKESVEILRQAKKSGLDVSCETAPHYLVLTDADLKEDGNYKMNPPLRSESDKNALIEGLLDGTIEMIATDHAPHSVEEKSRGLEKSLFGIVGLETAFPVLYTHLVKTGTLSLEQLSKLMSENPRKRFNLNKNAGITVFNLDKRYKIDPNDFYSMGRNTPFKDNRVFGECVLTMYEEKIVYKKR